MQTICDFRMQKIYIKKEIKTKVRKKAVQSNTSKKIEFVFFQIKFVIMQFTKIKYTFNHFDK